MSSNETASAAAIEHFEYKTRARPCSNGETIVAEVKYYLLGGNEHPHFALTATIYDRHRREYAGGCVHDEIAQAFPELAPFIRGHNAGPNGPMHYVANGLFHHNLWTAFIAGPPWDGSLRDEHERRSGCTIECGKWVHYPREGDTLEQSRKNFYSTIIHGAVPTDAEMSEDAIIGMDKAELTAWLEGRLPALMSAFREDMEKVRALEAVIGAKS